MGDAPLQQGIPSKALQKVVAPDFAIGALGQPGPPALPMKKRSACCLELIQECPAPTNEIVTRSDLSQARSVRMCLAARVDHLPL
jgi:hypothetical protein